QLHAAVGEPEAGGGVGHVVELGAREVRRGRAARHVGLGHGPWTCRRVETHRRERRRSRAAAKTVSRSERPTGRSRYLYELSTQSHLTPAITAVRSFSAFAEVLPELAASAGAVWGPASFVVRASSDGGGSPPAARDGGGGGEGASRSRRP